MPSFSKHSLVVLAYTLSTSLAFVCSASPVPVQLRSLYVVKDSHPIPSGWNVASKAPADLLIDLQIGLKHGRFDELEEHLHQVSDPDSPRYGQHLSATEVNDLIKPSAVTENLVQGWLLDCGIRDVTYSSSRDWISARLPIHIVEDLLMTKYHIYQHVEDDATVIRSQQWSLPMHLHDHIDAIHPTNAFFRSTVRSKQVTQRSRVPVLGLGVDGLPTYEELSRIDKAEVGHMDIPELKDMPDHPSPAQACYRLATSPLCLRTMYGTLDYVPQAPDKVRIGIVNYLEQVNNKSDIELFLERYRPDAIGAASKIRTEIVAHGSDQQTPITKEQEKHTVGLEGNLNAETVIGLAHPLPITTYNVGGRPPTQDDPSPENRNEPYLEWLQYVLAQDELPQVITTSYADVEQTVPYWYAKRACQGFAQLGARGVSVLFASGDDGVGKDDTCFSNDGSAKPMFLPMFPASCPYVTTIGATRNWNPEIVAFDERQGFTGGGGFSNYFPRPRYQKDVVGRYVDSLGSMYEGLYNKTGRGYPDISVRGYHYITVWQGVADILDGTSASSPAAAAIFSLVNDALAAEGRPAMGWLNPWIYSRGARAFSDVTAGSNHGCNTAGFPATAGWDAATGLGTPWFPTLRALAQERRYRATKPWYMHAAPSET